MKVWRRRGDVDTEGHVLLGIPKNDYARDKIRTKAYRWIVDAVHRGSQLESVEGLKPSVHYRGPGPWFTTVRTSLISSQLGFKEHEVVDALSLVSGGLIDSVHKRVSIYDHRNELQLRPLVKFLRFKPIEEFVRLINETEG